jgi:uncharacterized membrane protein YqjE
MESAQTATDSCVPGSPGAAAPSDPGLLENVQALWHELRGLAHDHLQLAALETQRAGKSLVNMVVYAVAAAILLVSAWLGLMGAGVLWLIANGLNASVALLLVVALNIAAAFVLFTMIRRSSDHLRFPATVRSLKSDASMLAQPDKS